MGRERQTSGDRVRRWPQVLEFGLDDLPLEGLEAAFEIDLVRAAELLEPPEGSAPELKAPLAGTLTLQRLSDGWLVQGRIRTRIQAACDFCLAGYVERLETDFKEPVKFSKDTGVSDQEIGRWDSEADDEGFSLTLGKNGRVNLWPLVTEQFWLAWPQRFRCRPDCRGLCPECGTDLNQRDCGCRPQNAAAGLPVSKY